MIDSKIERWKAGLKQKKKYLANNLAVSEGFVPCTPSRVTLEGIECVELLFLMKLKKYRGLCNKKASVREIKLQ